MASFAVYFLVVLVPALGRRPDVARAALALLVVELFEATDGFGVMSNPYDPIDFVANALGVGFALLVDRASRAREPSVGAG